MNRRGSTALVCAVLTAAGCSALNKVDVCNEDSAAPITLNHRFEGIQKTGSPASTVALPGGEALVVFASEVGGRDPGEVTELRGVRLTAAGGKLPSCDKNDTLDDVLVPADPTNPDKQLRESTWIAPPVGPSRAGLLTFIAREADRPPELWGLFLESDGCPYGIGSDRRKTFLIATVAAGDELFGQSAVSLGAGKDRDDFLVIWEELVQGTMVARARVVRATPSGPEYLPTVLAADGGVAKLPDVPSFLWGMAPVMVGDNVAIAAYYSTGQTDGNVSLWFFDDHLRMLRTPVEVSKGDERGELLPGRVITSAWDGRTLLVGWIRNDASGKVRLFTRPFDGEGRPRGPAQRLGTQEGANDSFPAATAWPDHGFLVGWRQQGGQGEGAPRIMGRLLDSLGRPTFTARACGEAPFVISQQSDADRRQPSLAPLQSNDVLAVWTDDTKKATDSSGSSVQGRIVKLDSLFVGTLRPGGPKPPPLPAAPRGPDSGVEPDPINMCEAEQPGTVLGGDKCLCDSDCQGNATCGVELPEGLPGGACIKSCNPAMPDSCGPGRICKGNATAGFCWQACTTHEECGPGRACWGKPRYCIPHCATNEECRSGHCDLYRGLCAKDDQPLAGAGLMEACIRHDDCKSRQCVSNKCLTTCHPAKSPSCPDGGVCVPFPDGDGGLCLPPCGPNGECPGTTTCRTMTGMPQNVCL